MQERDVNRLQWTIPSSSCSNQFGNCKVLSDGGIEWGWRGWNGPLTPKTALKAVIRRNIFINIRECLGRPILSPSGLPGILSEGLLPERKSIFRAGRGQYIEGTGKVQGRTKERETLGGMSSYIKRCEGGSEIFSQGHEIPSNGSQRAFLGKLCPIQVLMSYLQIFREPGEN